MNEALFFFGLGTTPLELVSFVPAIIAVWLNVRQNHWGWLFAIASSAAYAVVFFKVRLYGDMGLQCVFIAMSAWGWHQWLKGGKDGTALRISRLSGIQLGMCALIWLVGFAALSWFLARWTDTDVPHADGFLTAGSLLAQALLSRKKLENWHVWIAVDVLYVGLYVYKELWLTVALYAVFIGLAALGLRAWRASLERARQKTADAER